MKTDYRRMPSAPLLYCPEGPNTRGQMAVFLVKTFNLGS